MSKFEGLKLSFQLAPQKQAIQRKSCITEVCKILAFGAVHCHDSVIHLHCGTVQFCAVFVRRILANAVYNHKYPSLIRILVDSSHSSGQSKKKLKQYTPDLSGGAGLDWTRAKDQGMMPM